MHCKCLIICSNCIEIDKEHHQLQSESEQASDHEHQNEHEDETEPESVATLNNEESYAESVTEELSEAAAYDVAKQKQLERLLRLEAEAEIERHIQLNRLAELEAEAAEEREAGKYTNSQKKKKT